MAKTFGIMTPPSTAAGSTVTLNNIEYEAVAGKSVAVPSPHVAMMTALGWTLERTIEPQQAAMRAQYDAAAIAVGAAAGRYAKGYRPEFGRTDKYFFASDSFRLPSGKTNVGSNNYRIDVAEFWSPEWTCNDFVALFPSSYADQTAAVQYELIGASPITFEGATLWANINATWVKLGAFTVGGSGTWVIDPSVNPVGVKSDGLISAIDVPPCTWMQVRLASNVPVNGEMIGGGGPSQSTIPARVNGANWGTTSFAASLDVATGVGFNGRLSGGGYYTPACIVAKPVYGLDRQVVWLNGDSIGNGNNSLGNYNNNPRLASGFVALALDDKVSSRRMSMCNYSIPSLGIGTAAAVNSGQSWRFCWKNRLDLLRLLPNRPYTDIATEHNNNGGLTDATYRDNFNKYFDLLIEESLFWGDLPAPLHQTYPIPRVGSGSKYCTTLADQAGTTDSITGFKLGNFYADLDTGYFKQLTSAIPVWASYAYDRGANRNKVRLSSQTFTAASDYTSGSTSISLNVVAPTTTPKIGDLLVLDKNNGSLTGGSAYIRSFTGTGPFNCTLASSVATSSVTTGTTINTSLVGDSQGLHPSTEGHTQLAVAMIAWKNAVLG